MSAPTIGQLVFVARPQVNGSGFDPGIVLANLGAGLKSPGSAYEITALVFSTPADGGNVTTMTVTAELYPTRVIAASQAPGSFAQPQAASVL
jgi:hypothetical protein